MKDEYRLMRSDDLPDHLEEEVSDLLHEMSKLLVKKQAAVAFAVLSGLVGKYVKAMPVHLHERVIEGVANVIRKTINE